MPGNKESKLKTVTDTIQLIFFQLSNNLASTQT